jgi:predicted regulator of Ras-like GTPase activity (Roadblock/LC7/MglB family)
MEKTCMVKKKKTIEVATLTEPVTLEDTTSEDSLRTNLEEVKAYEGVIGYILRNTTSASIDLKDPTKIIDYAILSSEAFATANQLAELFDLGNVKSILVEGNTVKMLSLAFGDNKIGVFMEKNADWSKVLKKLSEQ